VSARRVLRTVGPVVGARVAVVGAVVVSVLRRALVLGLGALAAGLVGRAATGTSAADLRGGVAALVVLAVALGALAVVERRTTWRTAAEARTDLRDRVYAALARGAAPATGEPAGALTDADLVTERGVPALVRAVAAAVAGLGVLVVLAVLHPLLAVAPLVVLVVLVAADTPRTARPTDEGDLLGALGADVVDSVQGLREVLASGTGGARTTLIDARSRALTAARTMSAGRTALAAVLRDTLVVAGVAATVLVAGGLVAGGKLSAAASPVAVVLAAVALGPLARSDGGVADAAGAAARVAALLAAPAPVPDVTGADVAGLVPSLELRGVTFRYAADGPEVLHDVSLTVEPGQTVALVGHSGAGKSTCAHLAVRLRDVTAGAVLVGGHDVRALPTAQLRRTVALVPQDVYLFLDSLADNIRLGRPEASDAEVVAAARAALAAQFVEQLPEGYATPAGELGGLLSGGQRQRLALARALLLDAPVLVLDEPVANLDVENERDLRLANVLAGGDRTTLVVAHRLSTITGADRVVMLERGRVLASGTHTELLRTCPPYRELVANRNLITDDTRKRPPVDVHGT